MSTIREGILSDVISMLNTSRPADVPVIVRSQTFDVDPGAKAVIVYPSREDVEPIGGAMAAFISRRRFEIVVECRAAGTDTTRPDYEIDNLCSWVVKTLAGKSKGVNLGNLYLLLVEQSTEWQLDQQDHSFCLGKVTIVAQYQTKANNPDAWA